MARDFAKQFYNSTSWRKCRDAYKSYRHYICEDCGKPGHEIHHKQFITPQNINDPNVTLSWDNLVLLCHDCHMQRHSRVPTVTGLAFDENGNLVKTWAISPPSAEKGCLF